jgi:hypothetical protein
MNAQVIVVHENGGWVRIYKNERKYDFTGTPIPIADCPYILTKGMDNIYGFSIKAMKFIDVVDGVTDIKGLLALVEELGGNVVGKDYFSGGTTHISNITKIPAGVTK